MKHLRWLLTGAAILGAEFGVIVLVFKTHYGPYIFIGGLLLLGAYGTGWAINQGK